MKFELGKYRRKINLDQKMKLSPSYIIQKPQLVMSREASENRDTKKLTIRLLSSPGQ